MGKVKKKLNGALAPSSPGFCNETTFLPVTNEMIEWYYTTPNTVSVSIYDIDETSTIVETVTMLGGYLKVRTETIGKSTKELIRRKYLFKLYQVV